MSSIIEIQGKTERVNVGIGEKGRDKTIKKQVCFIISESVAAIYDSLSAHTSLSGYLSSSVDQYIGTFSPIVNATKHT